MKALMKMKSGSGNLELVHIPEPTCDTNSVKIKVRYTGICGTDLHIFHDSYQNYPPVVLGHEFSGEVTEIGDNVQRVRPGDLVMILPSIARTCNKCRFCKLGYYMLCPDRRSIGSGVNGSFTEYVVVNEDMVFQMPPNITLKEAALAEPLACAVQAIEELTAIHTGDIVLLTGPGPIGLLCLSLLVAKGCKVIVAGTSQDELRFNIAKNIGACKVVDVLSEDIDDVIAKSTSGQGVDVVIECSGAPSAVKTCLKSVKKLGKYIQVGIIGSKVELEFDTILYKQLQLYGSYAHSMETWEKVQKILTANVLNLEPIITNIIPLSNWENAFKLCEGKECGKVLMYYDYS